MKGLLLKDLCIIGTFFRAFRWSLGLFLLCQVFPSDHICYNAYPAILCGMILHQLFLQEDKSNWFSYSATLPVTRGQIVSCKYLLLLFAAAGMTLLSVLIRTLALLWNPDAFEEYFLCLTVSVLLYLLPGALGLPFIFRYGMKKGGIPYQIFEILSCVTMFVLQFLKDGDRKILWREFVQGYGQRTDVENFQWMETLFGEKQPFLPWRLLLTLLTVGIILFALSWYLSVRFYKKRKL